MHHDNTTCCNLEAVRAAADVGLASRMHTFKDFLATPSLKMASGRKSTSFVFKTPKWVDNLASGSGTQDELIEKCCKDSGCQRADESLYGYCDKLKEAKADTTEYDEVKKQFVRDYLWRDKDKDDPANWNYGDVKGAKAHDDDQKGGAPCVVRTGTTFCMADDGSACNDCGGRGVEGQEGTRVGRRCQTCKED